MHFYESDIARRGCHTLTSIQQKISGVEFGVFHGQRNNLGFTAVRMSTMSDIAFKSSICLYNFSCLYTFQIDSKLREFVQIEN